MHMFSFHKSCRMEIAKWRIVFITMCIVILYNHESNCARILGVFHMPESSHIILGKTLMRELARRGHQVTFITPVPFKAPIPNIVEIHVEESAKVYEALQNHDMFQLEKTNMLTSLFTGITFAKDFVNLTLANNNVQKLLKSDAKFDVIIIEHFYNVVHHVLGYHYNAPVVLMSTIGSSPWSNILVRNPENPSYIPPYALKCGPFMTFVERLLSTLYTAEYYLVNKLHFLPQQDAILRQYFPDAPKITDLMYNISLILLNSHISTTSPVPHVPNMIEIGGFHVQTSKPLPEDLQDYLDSATDGAIYFSMGSNLMSSKLPADKRNAVLKVFSQLKQKVLWKWEEDNLPGQPDNVKIGKWLPQQDILAHPNIKVFISHGGLLSTIETIHRGVPMLGIPIFADQAMNVATAVSYGYAISIPYKEWSEEAFSKALNEILNNPKYGKTAKSRSKIMHDQPMKPLETAMFWIEYVIRNKGAHHLRTSAMELPWYQYSLIDVIAFIISIVMAMSFIIYKGCRRIFRRRKTVHFAEPKNGYSKQKLN